MGKIKILIVGREGEADLKFGLKRALDGVVNELTGLNFEFHYVNCTRRFCERMRHICNLESKYSWLVDFLRLDKQVVSIYIERIFIVLRVKRILKRRRDFDWLWFQDDLFTGVFSVLCPKSKQKILTSMHGYGASYEAAKSDGVNFDFITKKCTRVLEKYALVKKSNYVVAPTRECFKKIGFDLNLNNSKPENWWVIPHGRTKFTNKRFISKSEARSILGLNEHSYILLLVARNSKVKNIPLALEAFNDVYQSIPNSLLIILGVEEHEIERSNRSQPVRFVSPTDPKLYYTAADIYISCSESESWGFSNVEALCHGLPMIVCRTPSVYEVLHEGAVYVDCNPKEISSEILYLFNNEEARNKLINASINQCDQLPKWEEVASAYQLIFNS